MKTYIVYSYLGEGSYAQTMISNDLAACISSCTAGGRVEEQIKNGNEIVGAKIVFSLAI